MLHRSLVLNFLVKKQTWKEERKSEEKQRQTTRERKEMIYWFFYFTYNWVCVILSLWLQINLLRKVEQSEQYICKHKVSHGSTFLHIRREIS